MIILLSPAKTLDFTSPVPEEATLPRFAREAASIARAAARLAPADLAALMHISDNLAELNATRFRTFRKAEERPAIRAFAGDVYRGFDVKSADEDTIGYAQDHLRILSGLYGVLRPLDGIRPYRLEMGTAWSPSGGKLVEHWGRKVARAVLDDVKSDGSGVLMNLASNEYFAVVQPFLPKKKGVTLVSPDFRVRTAKGLQFQSFTAKVARGTLARWLCEERIEELAALPRFDRDGWAFDEEGSTAARPLFVKG
ncbi:peroxide stress protein YaaA [Sphingomonas sp. LHG3406-1]|uniref:YaaA family protein n=1 Tax=Sphingomonas sp. LHG3406-1 TaxID=2804617 RepID=UPI002628D860|nr:peroxide stress protein YaaA [Sphingomonas sp. LHG3406-1]